jgi:DNA-binding transcriptional LysR family regulator
MKWTGRIGRRLKLTDLHIFITVAEMGSMGKAADHLSLSQPAVSKAIADMEHTIGVRLLDRGPRGAEVTPHGRALLRRGIGAFDELRQGIKDIEFLADPATGEVRVGSPEAFASGLLVEVLARFCDRYPRVTVNVHAANNMSREFRLLRDRTVDFMLGAIEKPPMEEDLDAEILYEDRPFIVSGTNNVWANRRKIKLAELIGEPWLLPGDSIFNSILTEAFLSQGLALPKKGVRSYSIRQRISLLGTNRFISALPGSLLRFNTDRLSLKVLPVDFATRFFAVAIVKLKSRTVSPVVQTFIDCVHEVARPLAQDKSAASFSARPVAD